MNHLRPLYFYVQLKVYKPPWKIQVWALLNDAWSHRVVLSFSLYLFFRLISWSSGALCIHFFAWASKTHLRRCPRWGHLPLFERVPATSVNTASPFSGALLAFCVNQGKSASFLSFIFLTENSFLISLYISLTPCHPCFGYPGSKQG